MMTKTTRARIAKTPAQEKPRSVIEDGQLAQGPAIGQVLLNKDSPVTDVRVHFSCSKNVK